MYKLYGWWRPLAAYCSVPPRRSTEHHVRLRLRLADQLSPV